MKKILLLLLAFALPVCSYASSPAINMFNNQVASGVDLNDAIETALAVSTDADAIELAQTAVAQSPSQAPAICASVASRYPNSVQSIVFVLVEVVPDMAPDIAKACAEQVPSESAVIAASAIAASPEQAELIILAVSDVIFLMRDSGGDGNQVASSNWEAENVRGLRSPRTDAYLPEPMPISERNFRASASPN